MGDIAMRAVLIGVAMAVLTALQAGAQDRAITFATVTRAPFSIVENGVDSGFSIALMQAIAEDLGRPVTFQRFDTFGDMLQAVESGALDGAIANISVTAEREAVMDFSQPIFAAGLQILVPQDSGGGVIAALFSRDILFAILIAAGLLFGGGMLMWSFERGRQEYFQRPAKEAMFPSFWWALNLVVNGGFEERMPRSPAGRVLAVFLVIASLFIVSVFVAKITAAMTVEAIQGQINGVNDLDGQRVGTIAGSTAEAYLGDRDIGSLGYNDLTALLEDFEAGQLDAVVFDGPILAFWVNGREGRFKLLDRVFKPENYAIALPSGSALREDINQSLLKLREDGTYARLVSDWFGSTYAGR